MKLMHTRGPWVVSKHSHAQELVINAPKGDPNLGYTAWDGMIIVFGSDDFPKIGKAVAKANATLITAAPDMLEALIAAHQALQYISDYDIPLCTHDIVRRAIEKATGKSITKVITE